MNENITDFITELPLKLDSQKKISLYSLIKKKCPVTVKKMNIKLNGKNIIKLNSKKWYPSIINYLVTKDVLETEKKDNNQTYHNVTDKYLKYFIHPKSTVYSDKNIDEHLILYKQTSLQFLEEVSLIDKNGKEFYSKEKKENNSFFEKHKKITQILSIILLAYSSFEFFLLISKYGLKDLIPMLLASIIFSIGLLLFTK